VTERDAWPNVFAFIVGAAMTQAAEHGPQCGSIGCQAWIERGQTGNPAH
jgi:hypothetical protein